MATDAEKIKKEITYKRDKIIDNVKESKKLWKKYSDMVDKIAVTWLAKKHRDIRTKYKDRINLVLMEIQANLRPTFKGKKEVEETLQAVATPTQDGWLVSDAAILDFVNDFLARLVSIRDELKTEIARLPGEIKYVKKTEGIKANTGIQKEKVIQKAEIQQLKKEVGLDQPKPFDLFAGLKSMGTIIVIGAIGVGAFFIWKNREKIGSKLGLIRDKIKGGLSDMKNNMAQDGKK